MMDENKPVNRRRFFRQGLRELLKPLVEAVEPFEQAMKQLDELDRYVPPEAPRHYLRPPGALDEQAFRDTCSRCGICVSVCPAHCIKIDPSGKKANGVPYIEPEAMPCVVCDGLICMRDCPSGALVPTALALIDMGTAVWDPYTCVRAGGENCTICIDRCPVGSVAIELKNDRVHVIEDGCIGCGVCEHDCPTTPKSIVVVPRAARA